MDIYRVAAVIIISHTPLNYKVTLSLGHTAKKLQNGVVPIK